MSYSWELLSSAIRIHSKDMDYYLPYELFKQKAMFTLEPSHTFEDESYLYIEQSGGKKERFVIPLKFQEAQKMLRESLSR